MRATAIVCDLYTEIRVVVIEVEGAHGAWMNRYSDVPEAFLSLEEAGLIEAGTVCEAMNRYEQETGIVFTGGDDVSLNRLLANGYAPYQMRRLN